MNTEIRNWPHFAMEMVSILLLLCCFIPLVNYGKLAGVEVPSHFDITGAVNGTSNASIFIFLPCMALAIFALLTVAEKHPKMVNSPKKLSSNGKEWLDANNWKFVRELKLCMTGLFTYIIWSMYAVATGKAAEVQLWGFTLFIALTIAVTLRFYYLLYNHN